MIDRAPLRILSTFASPHPLESRAHYFPERAGDRALIERVLVKLRGPDSSLFQSLDPAPERAVVAELRQYVLRAVKIRTRARTVRAWRREQQVRACQALDMYPPQ